MSGSDPPGRRNARKYTLAVGTTCFFLGVVLGVALVKLIAADASMETPRLVQVIALIVLTIAESVAFLYYVWRLNQLRNLENDQSQKNAINSQETDLAYATKTLPKDDKEVEHIFNIYTELGLIERHFNDVQSSYRRLASTWLLADFAAIGFVISTKLNLLVPPELFIVALGIAGGVGICSIWLLDLLLIQRLQDASFSQSRDLEEKHKWLPHVRTNMRILLGGKGTRLASWFYIAGVEATYLASGVGLILWLTTTSIPVGIFWLVTVDYVIGILLILVLMRAKTVRTPLSEAQIEDAKGGS
jgi:hypothetical protein